MDISKIAQYDQSYRVEIKHPVSGDPVGISFDVVSFDSERVVKTMRTLEMKRVQSMAERGIGRLPPDEAAEGFEASRREQVIAAVVGWDFGEHSFAGLGVNPEFNDANKRVVFEHPSSSWIRDQIEMKAGNIAGFFLKSDESFPKESEQT